MADAELIELQKQFAAVQLQESAHKVSERTCVDIVQLLVDKKLVELIPSTGRQEWVTPQQLKEEIDDEILARGGRVSLLDLQPTLAVDMKHVEEKARQVLQSKRSMVLLDGEIIAE